MVGVVLIVVVVVLVVEVVALVGEVVIKRMEDVSASKPSSDFRLSLYIRIV